MPDRFAFKALGPLEIRVGDEPGPHLPPLPRRLLAALLSRAGRHVTVGELAEAAWPREPPPSAGATLQVHLHRLRRALGDSGHLNRGPAGYRIDVTADEFDVLRFTALVEHARAERERGRPVQAAGHLDRALGLWRGEPYAGIEPSGPVADAIERLSSQRSAVRRELQELRLDTGGHRHAVAPLTELAAARPDDERLTALLMLALHRSGRQAEAVRLFQRRRHHLAEACGVDPGPLLQRMHRAVLRDEAWLRDVRAADLDAREPVRGAQAAVPRELPAAPHRFTGRAEELRYLDRLLDAGTRCAVVAGMGGVGKTALATHWAHRVADRFPDGQLFVDLHGYSGTAQMRTDQALAAMLESLGEPSERVPLEPDRAAVRFRSLTASRRMLVVLDNAASAEQVEPLLPAGAASLALVTSRDRLERLATRDDVAHLPVEPLTPGDAQELIVAALRMQHIEADTENVAALAEYCGRLPLALHIAAANLADSNRGIAAYTARLQDGDRLALLEIDGSRDAAVRAAFQRSYDALPAEARRVFRLLGLIPGPDFTADAAARLADVPETRAAAVLDRLTAAHLVDRHRPSRYRLHDLLRRYAEERADADEQPRARSAAGERLLDWYLHRADACRRVLYPGFTGLPVPATAGAAPEPAPGEAIAWLDAERANLTAAVRYAADHGPHPAAWLINDALRGHFWLSMRGVDALRTGTVALDAAERAGDLPGRAAAELALAYALIRCNRSAQATEHGARAARLAAKAGWGAGRAAADQILAAAYTGMGRLGEAAAHGTAALRASRELGNLEAQCVDLNSLGVVHCQLGELAAAADYFRREAETAAAAPNFTFTAAMLANLAHVNHLLGRLDLAEDYLLQLLDLRNGPAIGQFSGHYALAAWIRLTAGRVDAALEDAELAAACLGEFSDHRLEVAALCAMGAVRTAMGEHREAVACHGRALELAGDGALFYRVLAAHGRSVALHRLGEFDRAREAAAPALATARRSGYRVLEGMLLNTIAETALAQRRPNDAAADAEEALRLHRRTGHRFGEAEVLRLFGDIRSAAGDQDGASRFRDEARSRYAAMGAAPSTPFRD